MDLGALNGLKAVNSLPDIASGTLAVCRFYEEGRCLKGSACPFLHPEGREGVRRGVNRLCYSCNEPGHLARDCPRNGAPIALPGSLVAPGGLPGPSVPGPFGTLLPPAGLGLPEHAAVSAAIAQLPPALLGPPSIVDHAAIFNAAAAAVSSTPFNPAVVAVSGLEAAAAADREQIRKLEGATLGGNMHSTLSTCRRHPHWAHPSRGQPPRRDCSLLLLLSPRLSTPEALRPLSSTTFLRSSRQPAERSAGGHRVLPLPAPGDD